MEPFNAYNIAVFGRGDPVIRGELVRVSLKER
jgi:hypothetical protein